VKRALLLLVAAGCASVPAGMPGGPQSTIPVDVRVTAARATAATVRVLTDQGYVVAASEGGVIRTTPRPHNRATTFVITANVVPLDSAARVVLSGAYTIPTLRIRDEPMTPGPRLKGELWPRLQLVADSIAAVTGR